MKIEIEISDNYVKTLSAWASVSRTLKTARKACSITSDANADDVSDTDREIYAECENELHDLIPALDHLHSQARQAMWNIANRAKAVAVLEKTTPAQRAVAIKIMNSTANPQFHSYYDRICETLGVPLSLWPEAVIDWLRSLDSETGEAKIDA